jgi:uncharacterized membrane protein
MTPEPQQPSAPPPAAGGSEVREQDKIMLVLSYFGILSLIPLLTVKDSPYVKYHAAQGTALGIATFVLALVLPWIPFLGWIGLCLLFPAALVVSIMGIVKAFKGERWVIPGITDLAHKMFGAS